MRQLIALIILGLSITLNVGAQSYKFDFTSGKKTKDGYIKITSADRYANAKGYGYDLSPSPDGKNHAPFFFSVAVPDGNYHVTAIIGSKRSALPLTNAISTSPTKKMCASSRANAAS